MKNTNLILITIISLVVLVSVYTFTQRSSDVNIVSDKPMVDQAASNESNKMMNEEPSEKETIMDNEHNVANDGTSENEMMIDDEPMDAGKYVEFNQEVMDQTSNTRRVLFFYASWCTTCRPADANLKANIDKIPSDVTVIRVNYQDPKTDETEKELAKKYAVTYQHTFVQIDSEGKEITRWNGGSIDELLSNIK